MSIEYDKLVIGVDDTAYSWEIVEDVKIIGQTIGVSVELFHCSAGLTRVEPEMHDAAARAHVPFTVHQSDRGAEGRARTFLHQAKADNAIPVITTHGRRAVTASLVGSTAGELIHRTDRPILVYGPQHELGQPLTRVVVCLDGTSQAESVLMDAAHWAASLDVPLWIVEAFDPSTRDKTALGETNYLRRVADLLPEGLDVNWDTLHEKGPAKAILEFVNEEHGTLTAMSTHGRQGLSRLILGSVTADVVRGSSGPLLIRNPHQP